MVNNEEFYNRIQKVRDYYMERGMKIHKLIVCDMQNEVFRNEDEIPSELIFSGHHYTKDMVEDVLRRSQFRYTELCQLGDYFLIRDLTF